MTNFGVVIPQYGVDYKTIVKVTLECERLGFDSAWLEDHFIPWHIDAAESAFECWTTLCSLAPRTERIRLGTLCTCVSYRYPSLLAKMASTFDVISKGRLELGLGAGWYEEEYNAFGIPFPPPAVRIRQLREAIQIIRLMWTEEKPTFEGKYYRIKAAICNPKPAQKPMPKIWVGGGGEKLMLKAVAEYADGWNYGGLTPDGFKRKWSLIEGFSKALGKDAGRIKRSLETWVIIDETEKAANLKVENLKRVKAAKQPLVDAYMNTRIAGDPSQCVDQLKRYVEAGVEYFMLVFPDAAQLSSLQLFAERVLPAFR